MSDSRHLLTATAERLFAELRNDDDIRTTSARIVESGFPGLLVSSEAGGFGGDWMDAVAIIRLCGLHALAVPLSETIIAHHAASLAGLKLCEGPVSVAAGCDGDADNGRFTGRLKAVAWGRFADEIVAAVQGRLLVVQRRDAKNIIEHSSPASDPRDTLIFDDAPAAMAASPGNLFELGALSRVALIAGGLDGALKCSIDYANERVQFGRPIGKFQTVQQSLALLAEEAAAVNCAAEAAARAVMRGDAGFEVAAAKLRANMAAGAGAAIAHQVHGAIGFSQEYALQRWTRRLVSWVSEFGSERLFARRIGEEVSRRGADCFWDDLTRRSDLASNIA